MVVGLDNRTKGVLGGVVGGFVGNQFGSGSGSVQQLHWVQCWV